MCVRNYQIPIMVLHIRKTKGVSLLKRILCFINANSLLNEEIRDRIKTTNIANDIQNYQLNREDSLRGYLHINETKRNEGYTKTRGRQNCNLLPCRESNTSRPDLGISTTFLVIHEDKLFKHRANSFLEKPLNYC